MLPQGAPKALQGIPEISQGVPPRPSKASPRSPRGIPKVFPRALPGVSKAFQGGVHDILDWKRLSRRCPQHTVYLIGCDFPVTSLWCILCRKPRFSSWGLSSKNTYSWRVSPRKTLSPRRFLPNASPRCPQGPPRRPRSRFSMDFRSIFGPIRYPDGKRPTLTKH